jgi:hypothetical protein
MTVLMYNYNSYYYQLYYSFNDHFYLLHTERTENFDVKLNLSWTLSLEKDYYLNVTKRS